MATPIHSINSDNVASYKLPPHSIEAEQAVLGGLMLDNNAWELIGDKVIEDDFYREDHRLIFKALVELAEEDKPRDVVTVGEWLENNGDLEKAGGLMYVATLAKETPSAANIRAYADIVRERSVLRQLIGISNEIADSAYNPDGREPKELLDAAETKIFKIAEQGMKSESGFQNIKKLMSMAVDRIDEMFNRDSHITGIETGFTRFDEVTAGLQPSDLIIVAARPSMGKTSFAMNLVEAAAIKNEKAVAVFSMEMSGEQIATRLISSLGRINQSKLRTGDLGDADWPRITSAISMLNEAKIFIDDTPGLSPNEVRARCRRLARQNDLGLIVIDYLQLMTVPGNRENRATEISEISRSLKALAKELNVPVIALSQLNRSLETRPDKRPVMSDLRESGAIEQDADMILCIYRDEVYNEDSPHKGTAEILIRKHRNGSLDNIRLTFLGEFTRFENFVAENYSQEANF